MLIYVVGNIVPRFSFAKDVNGQEVRLRVHYQRLWSACILFTSYSLHFTLEAILPFYFMIQILNSREPIPEKIGIFGLDAGSCIIGYRCSSDYLLRFVSHNLLLTSTKE